MSDDDDRGHLTQKCALQNQATSPSWTEYGELTLSSRLDRTLCDKVCQ
jgi:hypothetical protein